MTIYTSFALLVNTPQAYYTLLGIFLATFPLGLIRKEAALARLAGWKEYTTRTWALLPKIFPRSAMASGAVYAAAAAAAYQLWLSGGLTGILEG